jgi:hypothetical protein
MSRLDQLTKHLRPGRVYRREDLAQWSKSVDRHARELLDQGVLTKLRNGLYYCPENSVFGQVPPDDAELVRSFLREDEFLLTSFNAYNALGVGTTQLYNQSIVYNHKRHGVFNLGGRVFEFRRKPRFPKKLTQEFLVVDLLNNLQELAEDEQEVKTGALRKLQDLSATTMRRAARLYGKVSTRKLVEQALLDAA